MFTKSRSPCLHPASGAVKHKLMNRLYFGDNLPWLRDPKEFPDASVDLDPPLTPRRQ